MSDISKMAEEVCYLYSFLNNNKVESIHRQKYLCGNCGMQVETMKRQYSLRMRKAILGERLSFRHLTG